MTTHEWTLQCICRDRVVGHDEGEQDANQAAAGVARRAGWYPSPVAEGLFSCSHACTQLVVAVRMLTEASFETGAFNYEQERRLTRDAIAARDVERAERSKQRGRSP